MLNLLRIFCLATAFLPLRAQLTGPGDIAFVGFNADPPDGFAFVALVDIPAGSTIYFTDEEWNGSPIGGGGAFIMTTEGCIIWTAPLGGVAAGTVVTVQATETTTPTTSAGTAAAEDVATNMNLAITDERVYAFLGTNCGTPSAFLASITNDGSAATSGTLTGTGLVAGVNAVNFTGDPDILVYNGSTVCNGTVAACLASINNPANWGIQDGGGEQDQDGIFPDFPDDLVSGFTGSLFPVEWLGFWGQAANQQVDLAWATASERNSAFFTVERRVPGAGAWHELGLVPAAGNSTQRNDYGFVDAELPADAQVLQYRLRQTDYDGRYSYSSTIEVRLSESLPNLQLYPNPAQYVVWFNGLGPEAARVQVHSLQGHLLLQAQLSAGQNLDVSGLPQGAYVVRVAQGQSLWQTRLLKLEAN